MRARFPTETRVLVVGDILVIGLVTLIGFARHGELLEAGLRPLATFLPYSLVWLLIAPLAGSYRPGLAATPSQLWRPAAAALGAAPFAAMLRSVVLQTPVQPIFVIVLALTGTLGVLGWRSVYLVMRNRLRVSDG